MLYAKFTTPRKVVLDAARIKAEQSCQNLNELYPVLAVQKDKTVKVAGQTGAIMALIGALSNMGEESLVRVWNGKEPATAEPQGPWTQLSFLDLHLEKR